MEDCVICCLTLHKKGIRRPIKCFNCDDIACLVCNRRYLLECETDPHCMFCKTGWTFNFLSQNFPLSFIHKELKQHREEKLFSEERSLLPATQTDVETEKRNRNAKKLKEKGEHRFEEIRNGVYKLQKERSELYVGRFSQEDEDRYKRHVKNTISPTLVKFRCSNCNLIYFSYMKCRKYNCNNLCRIYDNDKKDYEVNFYYTNKRQIKRINKIKNRIKDYKQEYKDINLEIWKIKTGNDQKEENIEKTRQKSFIMPCIVDGCRGYLSTGYKCPLCEIKVCSKCHKKKEEDHSCTEDDVKTVASIRKETRPCPNCGSRIYKISGCNNMFCTNCGTPFNWKTGLISSRQNIDNPHAAEWMRNHRDANIDPCQPNFNLLKLHKDSFEYKYLEDTLHNANHISEHYIVFYLHGINPTELNLKHRVNYLIGDIDETEFKKRIIINERKEEKKRELRLIYSTYCDVVKGLIKQCERKNSLSFIKGKIEEIKEIMDYTNKNLKEVSYYRKCKVKIIDKVKPSLVDIKVTKKTEI